MHTSYAMQLITHTAPISPFSPTTNLQQKNPLLFKHKFFNPPKTLSEIKLNLCNSKMKVSRLSNETVRKRLVSWHLKMFSLKKELRYSCKKKFKIFLGYIKRAFLWKQPSNSFQRPSKKAHRERKKMSVCLQFRQKLNWNREREINREKISRTRIH